MGLVNGMFRNNFTLCSSKTGLLFILESFTHSKTWECQIMNVYEICSNGKTHSLFEQQSKRYLLIGEKGFCFSG